jgi:hypothetical protein
MARPEIGIVVELSVPSDIAEVSIEQACELVQDEGTVPRVLAYNIDDYTRYGKRIDHLAWMFGITPMLDSSYQDGEWAVHNLKEGDERVTCWNVPP